MLFGMDTFFQEHNPALIIIKKQYVKILISSQDLRGTCIKHLNGNKKVIYFRNAQRKDFKKISKRFASKFFFFKS